MDEKHDDAGAQLCGHCGQKREDHWAANYAEGPYTGGHFLVCPTATFIDAVDATAPSEPAIAQSAIWALWALIHQWQTEVDSVNRRLPAKQLRRRLYGEGYAIAKLECMCQLAALVPKYRTDET